MTDTTEVNGHTLTTEQISNDTIYRCKDCGISQSTKGAFEIYRCSPIDLPEEET